MKTTMLSSSLIKIYEQMSSCMDNEFRQLTLMSYMEKDGINGHG